jgi:hypothetical protein
MQCTHPFVATFYMDEIHLSYILYQLHVLADFQAQNMKQPVVKTGIVFAVTRLFG